MNLCNNSPEGLCTDIEPLLAHDIEHDADVICVSGQAQTVLQKQGRNTQHTPGLFIR